MPTEYVMWCTVFAVSTVTVTWFSGNLFTIKKYNWVAKPVRFLADTKGWCRYRGYCRICTVHVKALQTCNARAQGCLRKSTSVQFLVQNVVVVDLIRTLIAVGQYSLCDCWSHNVVDRRVTKRTTCCAGVRKFYTYVTNDVIRKPQMLAAAAVGNPSDGSESHYKQCDNW